MYPHVNICVHLSSRTDIHTVTSQPIHVTLNREDKKIPKMFRFGEPIIVNCMAYRIKIINLHYGKFKIPHDNKFSAYFEDQFDICLSSLSYFDNFRMPFTYISLHNLPLLPIRCEKATELLVNAGLYHESQTMCCTDPYIPWWQHHTF